MAKSGGTIDNEERKDTKQGIIPQPRHVHTECLYMLFVLLWIFYRFRRESQEMWDKVQSEGTSKNDQTDQVDKQRYVKIL